MNTTDFWLPAQLDVPSFLELVAVQSNRKVKKEKNQKHFLLLWTITIMIVNVVSNQVSHKIYKNMVHLMRYCNPPVFLNSEPFTRRNDPSINAKKFDKDVYHR